MPYMTADDVRAWYPDSLGGAAPTISDEKLEALIAEFEDIAERYRGVAYIPREATETVEVTTSGRFLLEHMFVSAVDTVTVDGSAVAGYTFVDGYSVKFTTYQYGTLVVTYTHGLAEPPPLILRACREYVLSCALMDRSSVPRDAVVTISDGYTIRYSTPDWRAARPTGFLEVDRLLNSVTDHRFSKVG